MLSHSSSKYGTQLSPGRERGATRSDTKRLMLNIISDNAQNRPERSWIFVPRSPDPKNGWQPITYGQGAKAIDWVAHKISTQAGKPPTKEFPTIAYIGPNDIRYIIFMFAAIKAGYQALFISPRNSHEGQMNLFEKTNCKTICFDAAFKSTVQPWLQERDMNAIIVLSADHWFSSEEVTPFPYQKTFDEAKWDPFVVLHTSGSTGLPKPVICRQGMIAISDAYHNLPKWNGTKIWLQAMAESTSQILVPMPLFHAAGLYMTIISSLYWDRPVYFSSPGKPLTSDTLLANLEYCEADAVLLPPIVLDEISQSDDGIKALAKLNAVTSVGGNLPQEVGDKLVSGGVKLENLISATEFTPFPIYQQTNRQMWHWFILNSDLFGCQWRPTSEPDVFEQVILRKQQDPGLQGFFYTFPELREYSTKDLYKRHPTRPDHWLYQGRADDIIVFSNGEKLNPVSIESIVMGHPDVKGALVVGTNEFQPALLVEPHTTPTSDREKRDFIDRIWPCVVQANKETVAHGQIGRKFIALSKPDMPFLRASKGSIRRAETVRMYKDYIDQFYEDVGREDVSDGARRAGAGFRFFQAGVDSMQVINASRLLKSSLEAAGVGVSAGAVATRVIYGNPTPRRLARYLYSLVRTGQTGEKQDDEHEVHAMEALLDKYTRDLPPAQEGKAPAADRDQTIVLTGSTGALGSYLLDYMCRTPNVKRIICLNRSENARERQREASKARGLGIKFDKVDFFHADLSKADLGLTQDQYASIRETVDRIVHNQWPVNFNMPVESFEPHIRGVRHLVDLSAKAKKRALITFISSIGTVDRWPEKRPVPEESIKDFRVSSNGYGMSKLVSSLILEQATEKSGIPTEVIRVGQIGGPVSDHGEWNKHEWLPSIIASSVYLGVLPQDLGVMETVDWTPIEGITKMVLELSGISKPQSPEDTRGYFHGVNPSTTTWGRLAPAVKEFYGSRIQKLVPLAEWVDEVEKSQAVSDDVTKNPAIKLLDSYRGMCGTPSAGARHVDLETRRTTTCSETLRNMQPVTPALMRHWCSQWGF
ncbi:unnamed protein product [Parascedosporium putredinis]|uniref:Uncharacterized protein n=1 Tax=Parascedosporium putredinis TaxID=1442378 RepID=A0A9P1HBG4_9PEZI|nr:unnamed protein product [Parascedosporium putredinis]CAI8002785.1 unnamed protein product [Parascedosporium putredinis]